ncbi:MAG: hypothetical protein Q9224_004088, partial [Gallowayella concinna]
MAFEERLMKSDNDDSGLPERYVSDEKEHHLPINEEKQLHIFPFNEQNIHDRIPELPSNSILSIHQTPNAETYDQHWHTPQPEPTSRQKSTALFKKKRVWFPLLSLLLIAAVVGGTVGGLSARNATSNKEAPTASTGSPATSKSTASPSLTPAPSQTPSASLNSSLASVAWTDKDGRGYRRLYYQDSEGTIKESAWNSTGNQWYPSNQELAKARLNTPLAAAVIGNQTSDFV